MSNDRQPPAALRGEQRSERSSASLRSNGTTPQAEAASLEPPYNVPLEAGNTESAEKSAEERRNG